MAPKALFPTIFVLFHPIAILFLPNALAAGKSPSNTEPKKDNEISSKDNNKDKDKQLDSSHSSRAHVSPLGYKEQDPFFEKGKQQEQPDVDTKIIDELKKDNQISSKDNKKDKDKKPDSSHSSRAHGSIVSPLGYKEQDPFFEKGKQQEQPDVDTKIIDEPKKDNQIPSKDNNKGKGKPAEPSQSSKPPETPNPKGANVGNLEQKDKLFGNV